MKIKWTERIPINPGLYLTKQLGSISMIHISQGDLQIQKEDKNWLSGYDYWSIEPIEEQNE